MGNFQGWLKFARILFAFSWLFVFWKGGVVGCAGGEEETAKAIHAFLADSDSDGLADQDEIVFFHTNVGQYDTDGDGLSDGYEVCYDGNCLDYTPGWDLDPNNPDTDGDGYLDGWEVQWGFNPLSSNDPLVDDDADQDGIPDIIEYHYGTNPNNADTDGDGYPDGFEDQYGSDPLDPDSIPDVAKVVINEVFTGACLWVELYNAGSQPVDLNQWFLRFDQGAGVPINMYIVGGPEAKWGESFTLGPQQFVVLDTASGTNTATHLYSGSCMDFCETFGNYGSISLVDFDWGGQDYVRWGGHWPNNPPDPIGGPAGWTDASSGARKRQDYYNCPAGDSFQRDVWGTDTNSRVDWSVDFATPETPNSPDSDGDGVSDWIETHVSNTNASALDTDGDGYSDGLELQRGTDPTNPSSKPAGIIPELEPNGTMDQCTSISNLDNQAFGQFSGDWGFPAFFEGFSDNDEATITIISAIYGQDGYAGFCDATSYLSPCDGQHNCNDRQLGNWMCGDPLFGVYKRTDIQYACGDGVTRYLRVDEGNYAYISCGNYTDNFRDYSGGSVYIDTVGGHNFALCAWNYTNDIHFYTKKAFPGDMAFEFDYYLQGGANNGGVFFRATGEDNGFLIAIGSANSSRWEVWNRSGGDWYPVPVYSKQWLSIGTNQWHQYKLVVQGERYTLYEDGNYRGFFFGSYNVGSVGLRGIQGAGQKSCIDNILVTSLPRQPDTYTENFSDMSWYDELQYYSYGNAGVFNIGNHNTALCAYGFNDDIHIFTQNQSFGDAIMEFDYYFQNSNYNEGVFFRVQDSGNGYLLQMSPNWTGWQWTVTRIENGGWNGININYNNNYLQIQNNQWGHYRLVMEGDKFIFFENGVRMGNFTDSTYASGGVGLRGQGWNSWNKGCIDNIQVTSLPQEFNDNFSDGNYQDVFQKTGGGNAQVESMGGYDTALCAYDYPNSPHLYTDQFFRDGILDFDYYAENGADDQGGIYFRVRDKGDGYRLVLKKNWKVARRTDGNWDDLNIDDHSHLDRVDDEWAHYRLIMDGGQFSLFENGSFRGFFSDGSFASGGIGLRGMGDSDEEACIDNLRFIPLIPDQNWYCFNGVAGQSLSIDLDSAELGYPVDAYFMLYDSNGDEMAWNDDARDAFSGYLGADPILAGTLPSDGTYYLQVRAAGWGREAWHPYTLSFYNLGLDTDGDGIGDIDEVLLGTDPYSADPDGDGLTDPQEVCFDGDCSSWLPGLDLDPWNSDTDGDGIKDGPEVSGGITDPLNPDCDGDGLLDGRELALGTNPFSSDTDGDLLSDKFEADRGSDPLSPGSPCPPGVTDTDGDGLNNCLEDFVGTNRTKWDSDNDLLTDYEEVFNYPSDPMKRDTDGDGFDDGREVAAGSDPLDASSIPESLNCSFYNFYDDNSQLYDIACSGYLDNGTSDAYDGMYYLTLNGSGFPWMSNGWSEAGGREFVLGPSNMYGLDVTRKIYVPTDRDFARYLEILSNNTEESITVDVQISGNLGSDCGTQIITTSSGDAVFTPDDMYLVSDDGSDGSWDPALAHVFDGPHGEIDADDVSLDYCDNLYYQWNGVEVQPGTTVIVMHYAVQEWWRTDATAAANQLEADQGDRDETLYWEARSIVNWIQDDDGDGLSNGDELEAGTDPNNPDTDGDGMTDGFEVDGGLNPKANDAGSDRDSDGLTNGDEFAAGTDPNNPDTDGDSLEDGFEVNDLSTDPLDDDSDDDGLTDGQEVCYDANCDAYTPGSDIDPNDRDTDNDTFSDGTEVEHGFDPLNPASHPVWSCNGGCAFLVVNGTSRVFDSVPRTDTTNYVTARNNCIAISADLVNFDESFEWAEHVWMHNSADVAYYSYENAGFCAGYSCCSGYGWHDYPWCSCHSCGGSDFSNGNDGGYACVWR